MKRYRVVTDSRTGDIYIKKEDLLVALLKYQKELHTHWGRAYALPLDPIIHVIEDAK
jgi:hypothetical protein